MAGTTRKLIKISAANAQLVNINHGTEGNEKAPKRRLDLKFEFHHDGELLQSLSAGDDVPPLWHEHGGLRYVGFEDFKSRTVLEKCHFEFGDLELSKITVENVKAHKFVLTPIDHRAMEVSCTVSVVDPDDKTLVALSKAVKKKAQLYIECDVTPKLAERERVPGQDDLVDDDEDENQDADGDDTFDEEASGDGASIH